MSLIDTHGRKINYLRLSVTDRCNMRCFYCMPKEGIINKGHDAVLRYEELQLIAETAVEIGIEKIRITGGEPLVRAGIVGFIEKLSTNGNILCGEAGSHLQPSAHTCLKKCHYYLLLHYSFFLALM